jgi:two-component system KDP operon response regulator KdpE
VRILLVDDDPALVRSLDIGLRTHGHEVLVARDGRTALQAAREDDPDLVVLDLGLPDLAGPEVIRQLRAWTRLPIVVLSARPDSHDKVEALDLGADDYVTKPFGLEELVARIRAAGRRSGADRPEFRVGDLVISSATRQLQRDGQPVRLTPTEWSLLDVLLRDSPRLVSREDLLREVWGPGYERETHYLRVHVASLRKKLEPDPAEPRYVVTEPGMGYRFTGST